MKRALTRSDSKVEKDTVTLGLVVSRRHQRAYLDVAELGVRSVDGTTSAVVKLALELSLACGAPLP